MPRSQTPSLQAWLITDDRLGDVLAVIRRLPRRTGVLVRQHDLPAVERQRLLRQLRQRSRHRDIVIVDEADGWAARVHNVRELRRALVRRSRLIFLSPIHATRTHPDWAPLPRMRAAALARLSPVPLLALGGMNARRFRAAESIGLAGWGAIDAWLKTSGTRSAG